MVIDLKQLEQTRKVYTYLIEKFSVERNSSLTFRFMTVNCYVLISNTFQRFSGNFS